MTSGPGWIQVQPALASVMSVTPSESADADRRRRRRRRDDGWPDAADGAVGAPHTVGIGAPSKGKCDDCCQYPKPTLDETVNRAFLMTTLLSARLVRRPAPIWLTCHE